MDCNLYREVYSIVRPVRINIIVFLNEINSSSFPNIFVVHNQIHQMLPLPWKQQTETAIECGYFDALKFMKDVSVRTITLANRFMTLPCSSIKSFICIFKLWIGWPFQTLLEWFDSWKQHLILFFIIMVEILWLKEYK